MKDEDEDVGWLEARQKPVSNSFQQPVAVDEPTREAMLIIYFSTFLVALVRPQRRNEDKMEPTKLKPKRGDPSTLNFGRNLFTHGSVR